MALGDQRNVFAELPASQQEERVRQQCSEMLAEGAAFNLADHLRNRQDDDGKLQDANGNLHDLRSADQFAAAGFEVRFMDEDPEQVAEDGKETKQFIVEPATFDRWLEVSATKVGVIVQRWWTGLAAEESGVDVLKTHPDETAYDLFKRIRNGVEQRVDELQDVCVMAEDMQLVDEWKAVCAEDLSPWLLVWWLRRAMAREKEDLLEQVAPLTLDELVEQVHFEIFVMEAHDQQVGGSGATETEMGVSEDPNDRVLRAAQNAVFGWPSTDATPVPFRTPGRFAKAFPTKPRD